MPLTTVQPNMTGGGPVPIFLNGTNVSANYTIPASNNGLSAGPITIDTGFTVTIATGATWVIV